MFIKIYIFYLYSLFLIYFIYIYNKGEFPNGDGPADVLKLNK